MPDLHFLEKLRAGVLIADGAMGTELYQHGVFVNTCFDELNLSRPQLIGQIHRQYIQAGCDLIETNTFGANPNKLARFGLAEQCAAINSAAVHIAKQAVGSAEVLIAGAIGPLGMANPLQPEQIEQAKALFAVQIAALAQAGVDVFLFETFDDPTELAAAIATAAAYPHIPIVAQMTCGDDLETLYGIPIEVALAQIDRLPSVSVVGLNCSLGPSDMLEALKRIKSVVTKPISLQPNAGMPRRVEGRMLYMCTPEYIAEYAKRYFEHGATIIGGCCGTTPEHIRQIAKVVRALARSTVAARTVALNITPTQSPEPFFAAKPLAEKSALGRKLATGQKVLCVELTPPRGVDTSKLIDSARRCADNGVDAVNIPDGPRASARLSPLVSALKIQQHVTIETILHLCCRDKNLIGLQSDLLGIYAMGLRNVLLITGDPPKLGDYPDATGVFDLDAIALTSAAKGLNEGRDIAGNRLPEPLALTLGVGANPVASDLQRELTRFEQKVRAGAEYAITQPVFDLKMFIDFYDATKHLNIPLIAGIWPFTSYKNAEFMANEVPGVVVPKALLARMAAAKTAEQAKSEGVAIAREMIEALADYAAGFAVSAPFGNVTLALAVLGR